METFTILIWVMLGFPCSGHSPNLWATTPQGKPVSAKDDLRIGFVTLRLGMNRDVALSDLGKYYELKQIDPSTDSFDNWMIQNKARPSENVGSLRFQSGKLTLASKEWTPEDKQYSGADVAEIIYKLTSQFEREGDVKCSIRTFSSTQHAGPGGLEFRETEITCGHRRIEIILNWQSGPAWVQVSESIADDSELIP